MSDSDTKDDAPECIELESDIEENFDLFIEDAISTGCVWALEGEDGFALCPSEENPDVDALPLWSQPEFAKAHCGDEWKDYKVVPIALEELLDEWLPGMHEDILLVGVNFNKELEGLDIEPLDLLEQIDAVAVSMK